MATDLIDAALDDVLTTDPVMDAGLAAADDDDSPVAMEAGDDLAEIVRSLREEAERLGKLLDRKNGKDEELRSLESAVAFAESRINDLKAEMKEAKEDFDNCVDRLRAAVRRRETGQGELPFDQSPAQEETAAAAVAEPPVEPRAPIAVLSVEEMRLLIGAEEMKAAKEREEPVGLTPALMDKMAEGEVNEVQDLEVMMRESAYWWKDLKLGEKGMQRVIETLRVWRLHNPYPVEETADVIPMTAASAAANESA